MQEKLNKNNFLNILNQKKVMFIFDYDGTLVKLERSHNEAKLDEAQIKILNQLAQTKNTLVAIVTGRSFDNISELLENKLSKNIMLYGTHGAEKGKAAKDEKLLDVLNSIKVELQEEDYIFFEEKPISLTIHFNNHPEKEKLIFKLEKIATRFSDLFRIQKGHLVFEFLPKDINKGLAIKDLQAKFPDYFLSFWGDDLTDNFGFKVINELGGLSIQVSDRLREIEAGYLIDSVDSTYDLINAYLEKIHESN